MLQDKEPKYIAWIPTNSGRLYRNLVIKTSYKADNSNPNIYRFAPKEPIDFSDTIRKQAKKEELGFCVKFQIEFSKKEWRFELDLIPSDSQEVLMGAKGIIDSCSGRIEFSIDKCACSVCAEDNSCYHNINIADTNIPNTIFTFIKQQIHSDMHHSEKVDHVIPVLYNASDGQWVKETSHAFVSTIKQIENDAKRIYKEGSSYDVFKEIEVLLCRAKGFYAYFQSFISTNAPGEEKRLKQASNIIASLESLVGKVVHQKSRRGVLATIVATASAFFVSLNIISKMERFIAAELITDLHF